MSRVLAADIGGTNIRAAVIDANGSLLDEVRVDAQLSNPALSADEIIHIIADLLQPMITADITAVGLGFPGFFRGSDGVLAASPNLPNIRELPLAESLSRRLGIRVAAQNDALCAAIGEHRFGAGKGARNLLHITLGTGVGGGLILSDQPWTGEYGMAMEFGHVRVADERACGCGLHGCLEAWASATAVSRIYAEQTGCIKSAGDIYSAACSGDSVAEALLRQTGEYLGAAIAEAVKLLDVHTITISGGLSGAWSLLYPPLMARMNSRLIPPLRDTIHVYQTSLGDQAGLLGAAYIARS
ncbi:ROK family protein [Mariprofundus erugo]|uniref:ROK family protein n=1 Tax=Mariprofundus erugo TaxID=2528639 RepID=UPI0010FD3B50|nr:ROK family protein [Mariprofundus erugo]TLS76355.1 ROK family protein [Mariprofundus erugo]